jgi:hypothetical protein
MASAVQRRAIRARLEGANALGRWRLASGAPLARRASARRPSTPDLALGHLVERDAQHVGHELRPERRTRSASDDVGLRERRAGAGQACCASRIA